MIKQGVEGPRIQGETKNKKGFKGSREDYRLKKDSRGRGVKGSSGKP
jgi:hypothetical protein